MQRNHWELFKRNQSLVYYCSGEIMVKRHTISNVLIVLYKVVF